MTTAALPRLVLLPGFDGGGTFFAPLLKALEAQAQAEVLTYPERPLGYETLAEALLPRLPEDGDYVLLGGGNAKLMKELPNHVILGANINAVEGGLKLWETPAPAHAAQKKSVASAAKPSRKPRPFAKG